jgi:hypothetical protein
MKPFDYYKTVDLPYPVKLAYVTTYVYSKGEILWQGRGANLSEVRKQYPDALIAAKEALQIAQLRAENRGEFTTKVGEESIRFKVS